jgi:PHD/YefM family antitoxin component YafN of YafNO toxin-antitoxin module
MIKTMPKPKPRYVTDEKGKKTAVILPIEEYEELIEDIQDLAILAERREEPPISHEEVVAKLKQDGYL